MEISELVLENIIESLPVGLMVIGPGGAIIKANQALSKILGYPLERLVKTGWSQFFLDGEKNTEFNQVILDVIQKEVTRLKRHAPYVNPDGETRYLDIVSSYLKDDGELAAIVVLFDDVTEVHNLNEREKSILRQNNLIHQERSEGLNKLAMSIAHQVRNPVAAIGGFAGLLMRKTQDDSKTKYLQAIRDESVKLESLVEEVKEYACIQATNVALVDVSGSLERAMAQADRLAAELGKSIEWHANLEQCDALADEGLLQSAWEEILENCVEFTQSDQVRIDVVCRAGKDDLTISFGDYGKGIKSQNIPYLFDPFFTTKSESDGMGMAMVKRIIFEHHGDIHASNKSSGGLLIEVRLPRRSEVMRERQKASRDSF